MLLKNDKNNLKDSVDSKDSFDSKDSVDSNAPKDRSLDIFDPYKKYIYEIKNIPVLSRDDERGLSMSYYKSGDEDAAYKLTISNLRLVVKIAMEFNRVWINNISDLVQEGNIGLLEALKRYDPFRSARFSSYASFWIRAYIIKFIMENYSLIRIGKTQAQRKLFFNLNKEKRKLAQLGYDPAPKLLAEKLNVKEKEVTEMDLRLNSPILSFDEPIKNDSAKKHIDSMPYDEELIDERLAQAQLKEILQDKIEMFKKSLNPKERYIFENRVYAESPHNLRQLGEALNFSRERARQIESKVLKKLKAFLTENFPEFNSD